ncbi:MAG: hypothetical protein Q7S61_00375 [bacterium]|nr:hypothetical protein [bacterium]
MYKIQITLTPEEVHALSLKGKRLGHDVTKYVKFLITKEAYSIVEEIPTLDMSVVTEKKVEYAIRSHKEKKTPKMASVNDLER